MSDDIRERVRTGYAEAAREISDGKVPAIVAGCGDTGCCGPGGDQVFGGGLYDETERGELPRGAVAASLGCGNPTAVADLREGDVVLDLGSGGGIDVLLSARRVGPTGRAIGLDMTDEMLQLARNNAAEAGAGNVEFIKGHMEDIPLPDATVDVVISNCVVNLSPDKEAVAHEVFRVLVPGGRLGISDVVADGELDAATRADAEKWTGCIAGALARDRYEEILREAGFEGVEITYTHDVADGLHGAIISGRRPPP